MDKTGITKVWKPIKEKKGIYAKNKKICTVYENRDNEPVADFKQKKDIDTVRLQELANQINDAFGRKVLTFNG